MTRIRQPGRGRAIGSLAAAAAAITVAVAMTPSAAAAPVRTVNTWAEVAPTPEGRFGSSVAAGADGTVYAIGGLCPNLLSNCMPVATVEAYSPKTNTWTTRASMPTARQCLATTAGTDGRIYALGGEDSGGNPMNNAEVYSPTTNTWAVLPPMQDTRGCLAAATDSQGRIYAIGGEQSPSTGVLFASVDRYTPSTNSWAYIGTPMPQAAYELSATRGPDGRIYVIGGETSTGDISSSVYAYTPDTDTWATLAPISDGRGAFVGVTTGSDGRIYAIGGTDCCFDFTNANVVQAYTPATNSWATVPSTEDSHPASGVAAAAGRVFVVNSVDPSSFNEIPNVEAYTPAKASTTTLTTSANPATAGSNVTLTATVFPNSAAGTVTFMDGSTALGSASVGKGGTATLTTSSLSAGSHTLTASYSGNATYGGSTSSSVVQVIN